MQSTTLTRTARNFGAGSSRLQKATNQAQSTTSFRRGMKLRKPKRNMREGEQLKTPRSDILNYNCIDICLLKCRYSQTLRVNPARFTEHDIVHPDRHSA
jgi:hypothetical protein